MADIEKPILIFMPSIEGGGVEKNIIIISNYLTKHRKNLKLITYDRKFKSQFNKKIQYIIPKSKKGNVSKYYKYFQCLRLLINKNVKNNNILVFAFQATFIVHIG